MNSTDLKVVQDGPILRVTLNRPERRNSLTRALISEFLQALSAIQEDGEIRAVVLSGEGSVFCSGADIGEFLEAAESGRAMDDAEGAADLFAAMGECPVPIVARVEGAAFGGGVGLVCASDIAIAASGTTFSLSEARIGLVPAVISPFVLAALGEREAKARMLLAAPFDAEEALRIGLIQRVVDAKELDAAIDAVVADILRCAPGALAAIKRLPQRLRGLESGAARAVTTSLLAERLESDEGREGLKAFLEKRPVPWTPA